MRLPDFFVVGAPKCGTTALHEYLRRHPQLFMPSQKELHYFGSDLSRLPSQLDETAHSALFAGCDGAERVGETCIWALYSTQAAREIASAVPGARAVVMLREPVEMMYALHSEFLYHRIEDEWDFGRALDAEAERRRGRRLPHGDLYPPAIYFYRDVATFAPQVRRYRDALRQERVHVILFDDLCRDPAAEYGRLLAFLGVGGDFVPSMEVINPNKRFRSPALQRFLNDPDSAARRLSRVLFPFPVPRARMAEAAARWNFRYGPRRPMDSSLRRRLRREFEPAVRELAAVIRRDLSHWLDG